MWTLSIHDVDVISCKSQKLNSTFLMRDKPSSQKRGFRNIYDPPAKDLKPDFPRPHRKALMSTIFHKSTNVKKERMAGFGPSLVDRRHINPVAAAIDVGGRMSQTTYSTRCPVPIPPNYKKKLQDLDSEGSKIKKIEAAVERLENLKAEATISLKLPKGSPHSYP